VDVLASPSVEKPHAAPVMTKLQPAELSVAVDVLVAPPVAKPHGAPFLTELLPAELSAADTPQGSISRASFSSAGASPILDSNDSSMSSKGLETSEKSKPLSEEEEMVALREGLAELYASVAEQASDKRCETFPEDIWLVARRCSEIAPDWKMHNHSATACHQLVWQAYLWRARQ